MKMADAFYSVRFGSLKRGGSGGFQPRLRRFDRTKFDIIGSGTSPKYPPFASCAVPLFSDLLLSRSRCTDYPSFFFGRDAMRHLAVRIECRVLSVVCRVPCAVCRRVLCVVATNGTDDGRYGR